MAFTSIRRYTVDVANSDEIISKVKEGFVPIIKGTPGFLGYYVINAGDGVLASVSVFESQAGVEESDSRAADWVKEHLAGLITSSPQITEGELVISADT